MVNVLQRGSGPRRKKKPRSGPANKAIKISKPRKKNPRNRGGRQY